MNIGKTIIDFTMALLGGSLLVKTKKYFPHILYTFVVIWLTILFKIVVENTLSKVENNREKLEELKIYHTEKKLKLVSLDRLTHADEMLKERGSAVTIPDQPAATLDAREK